MVEAVHVGNSACNVNVRDVLPAVADTAPCHCQGSPLSREEFTQTLDLKQKLSKTQLRMWFDLEARL